MNRLPRLVAAAVSAVLAFSATPGGIPSAVAAPPPDDAGWIRQAGNGASGTKPVTDLGLTSVIFREDRFRHPVTKLQGFDRYRAWGGIRNPDGTVHLAMTSGGWDGDFFTEPVRAVIRDPNGNDVPFLLGDTVHFAVGFQNERPDWPLYWIVYWTGGTSTATTTNPNGTTGVASTRLATSMDGIHWVDDVPLGNGSPGAITGGTGFNAGMLGATDIVLNPLAGPCTAAPTAAFPFDCPLAIVYTAVSPSGATSIAAAGADTYDVLGSVFRGRTAPLLSPGGTSWDTGSVDLAKVRRRTEPFGAGYEMTYAGTTGVGACGGPRRCSLGVASSPDRVAWNKDNPLRAATEPQLFADDVVDPSLGPATFLFDGNADGHARGFISIDDTGPKGSTWAARTHPMPKTAPTLEVSKPDNGWYNAGTVAIDLIANDDRGTNVGLAPITIEMEVDGLPLRDHAVGWSASPTIVGAFHKKGLRIQAPAAQLRLADGEHVLNARIEDLDGEEATLTTRFFIDTTPPVTTITRSETNLGVANVTLTHPVTTPIRLWGTASDAAAGIESMVAIVTNSLGQRAVFDSRNSGSGFSVTPPSGPNVDWRWSAPAGNPILAVPGPMQFSILGRDRAKNSELPAPANTRDVVAI